MNIRKTLHQWKEYGKMADLAEIARRKFFNNCFDGALTCASLSHRFIDYVRPLEKQINRTWRWCIYGTIPSAFTQISFSGQERMIKFYVKTSINVKF